MYSACFCYLALLVLAAVNCSILNSSKQWSVLVSCRPVLSIKLIHSCTDDSERLIIRFFLTVVIENLLIFFIFYQECLIFLSYCYYFYSHAISSIFALNFQFLNQKEIFYGKNFCF